MSRRLALAVAAVLAVPALAGCMPTAPDGPQGQVAAKRDFVRCTGKPIVCSRRYRLTIRPTAGGEQVTVAAWPSQYRACTVGERYPSCLPKED